MYNGKQFAFHWQPRLKTGQGSLTRGLTRSPTWQDLPCLNCLHSELRAFSLSRAWSEALSGRRQNQSCVHSFLGKPNFLTTSQGMPRTRTMFLVDAISPAMASYSGLSSSARPRLQAYFFLPGAITITHLMLSLSHTAQVLNKLHLNL